MGKIKGFYLKNKKVIKTILITLLVVLTAYVIYTELKGMNFREVKSIVENTTTKDKIFFVVFGLVCFSFAAIYDFILAYYYKMEMPKKEVFRIGWISQSFNNFIGFGGVAGITIREFLYDKFNVDKKVVNKIIFIVLFSDLIGLFSLGLPSSIGLLQIGKPQYVPILLIMFLIVVVFIFSDKLPIKYFKAEDSVFSRVHMKLRVYLTLQSTFEWLLAALFFAVVMRFYQPEISIMESVIVYVLATIIGIISLIPGGLGSFEGASMLLFKMMGYSTPNIFVSLLVCRICYTIIPWIVGVILFITAPKSADKELSIQKKNYISKILSYCVLIVGAMLVISIVLPHLFFRFNTMNKLFPNNMVMINRRFTLLIGLLLLALSRGIKDQVKLAFNLSLMLLVVATGVNLMRGHNYLESIICLLIALALVTNRKIFEGEAEMIGVKQIFAIIFFTFAGFVLYGIIHNVIYKVDFISDINKYSVVYLKENLGYVLFNPIVVVTLITLMFGFNRSRVKFHINTETEIEKFKEFTEKYPSTEYTHLFYMNDKNFFINEKETVMFLYRPQKEHILVLGNPVGEEEDFEDAIDELVIWAAENKMIVSFYQITGDYLEYFINEGFKFLKIGEDAAVNIQEFNLEGKKNKILRKTMNSMETKGLEFDILYPPFDSRVMGSLKSVSDEWLGKRGEMQFSLGAFKDDYIEREPVFIIKNEEGGIEAFANMLPMGEEILSIDLMRHKENASDGIMDMLFISMFEWGKENGYQYFDMGIAPLSNVGNKLYSSTKEKMVGMAYNYGNKIYGFKGLRKYKSKFKPEWGSVYIAYKDDFKLPDILLSLAAVCNASSK